MNLVSIIFKQFYEIFGFLFFAKISHAYPEVFIMYLGLNKVYLSTRMTVNFNMRGIMFNVS